MLVCSMRVYNYYRQHYYTNIKGRLPPITKIIRRNKNARISFFVCPLPPLPIILTPY